jgi:TolB protein
MKQKKFIIALIFILTVVFYVSCSDSENCPTCPKPEVKGNVIDDLSIGPADFSSIIIIWTAPDSALEYDIRYSASTIDTSNWGSATQVANAPTPRDAGNLESMKIDNLESVTTYYFAIKFKIDSTTWSAMSNVADGITSTFDARDKIVYSSEIDGDWELFVMDGDGSDKIQITNNHVSDGYPRWTSSGSSLVYNNSSGGNNQINILDIINGLVTNLSNNSYNDVQPNLRLSDNKIVFFTNQYDLVANDIMTMNPDGTNRVRLTSCDTCIDYSPAWSPDGTTIIFTRLTMGAGGTTKIYTMNQYGLDVTELPAAGAGSDFDYSPDSLKIAFTDFSDIIVMDSDGTNLVNITNDALGNRSPSWSPDGTKIAYQAYDGNDYEIFVIDADGTNKTQLTDNEVGDTHPDWSPVQ